MDEGGDALELQTRRHSGAEPGMKASRACLRSPAHKRSRVHDSPLLPPESHC